MNPEDVDWRKAFQAMKKVVSPGFVLLPSDTWTWIPLPGVRHCYSLNTWYQDRFYFICETGFIKSISPDGSINIHCCSRIPPRVGNDGKIYFFDEWLKLKELETGNVVDDSMIKDVFPSWPVPGRWRRNLLLRKIFDTSGGVVYADGLNVFHSWKDSFVRYVSDRGSETCVGPNHFWYWNDELRCRPMHLVGPRTGPKKDGPPDTPDGFFKVNLGKQETDFGCRYVGEMDGRIAVIVKQHKTWWLVRQN